MKEKTVIQPQDKYVLRLPDGMRERIKEAAEANNRSMNAEIVARLEQSFDGGANLSDQQLRALKGLAESYAWRQAKLEIDIGHSIAVMRELIKLLKDIRHVSEYREQAVRLARQMIESASTAYLGRPYSYDQIATGRFVEEAPPADPLDEMISVADWVIDLLLVEYRRAQELNHVSPQA